MLPAAVSAGNDLIDIRVGIIPGEYESVLVFNSRVPDIRFTGVVHISTGCDHACGGNTLIFRWYSDVHESYDGPAIG